MQNTDLCDIANNFSELEMWLLTKSEELQEYQIIKSYYSFNYLHSY
jgi:hypothetical protein